MEGWCSRSGVSVWMVFRSTAVSLLSDGLSQLL